jgi:acyl phosphate:glycerol-3-phosphate acyltransferase
MPKMLLIAAASYLLGSIPFGYLLVRIFHGEDVRQSGSGNIGATNVSRKSPILGVLTLLLDALKGFLAVTLAIRLIAPNATPESLSNVGGAAAWSALLSVMGHMFPIWLKLRGGKGVATGLGSFLPIAPMAVLTAAIVFVVVILLFRYISLGSIVAVGFFPAIVALVDKSNATAAVLIPTSLTCLLIVAKHHENIRRILAGAENRFGSKPKLG